MGMGILGAVLALVTWAGAAAAQGFAGMGSAARDYEQVRPDPEFRFPRDHQPHPGFRIEWWYITANLTDATGADLGVQWTLFRQAMIPGARPAAGWDADQIWMGHAAVTTADDHATAEIFARGGIGQAGVAAAPFRAWIDDWAMESAGAGVEDVRLRARGDRFDYDLRLRAQGPLVPQGANGFSVKSPEGQASYYYSQPFYDVTGQVTLAGETREVTGRAWLDREWSSQALSEDQTGWDWFALHLPDGAKLMAYRLRHADGSAHAPGTYIDADGTPTPLEHGAFTFEVLRTTQVRGRDIPTEWRLQLPAYDIDIRTAPLNAQSYMEMAFPYWEGPIRYSGSHDGVGYLEMTGY